jgi:hypothetical protein
MLILRGFVNLHLFIETIYISKGTAMLKNETSTGKNHFRIFPNSFCRRVQLPILRFFVIIDDLSSRFSIRPLIAFVNPSHICSQERYSLCDALQNYGKFSRDLLDILRPSRISVFESYSIHRWIPCHFSLRLIIFFL